ncbi:hypothetical protein CLOM_g13745, partial [Closterium sp. NIES-68]
LSSEAALVLALRHVLLLGRVRRVRLANLLRNHVLHHVPAHRARPGHHAGFVIHGTEAFYSGSQRHALHLHYRVQGGPSAFPDHSSGRLHSSAVRHIFKRCAENGCAAGAAAPGGGGGRGGGGGAGSALYPALLHRLALFRSFQGAMLAIVLIEILLQTKSDVLGPYWVRLQLREVAEVAVFLFIGWTFRSRLMAPIFMLLPAEQHPLPPIHRVDMDDKGFQRLRSKDWTIGICTTTFSSSDSAAAGGAGFACNAGAPMVVVVQNPQAASPSMSLPSTPSPCRPHSPPPPFAPVGASPLGASSSPLPPPWCRCRSRRPPLPELQTAHGGACAPQPSLGPLHTLTAACLATCTSACARACACACAYGHGNACPAEGAEPTDASTTTGDGRAWHTSTRTGAIAATKAAAALAAAGSRENSLWASRGYST